MQVSLNAAQFPLENVDALILPVPEGAELTGALAAADRASDGTIALALKGAFKGKAEQVEVLYPVRGLGAARVVLVGLGKPEEAASEEDWRKAVSVGAGALAGKAARVAIALPDGREPGAAAEAAAEAFWLSTYRFEPYKTVPDPDAVHPTALVLLGPEAAREPAERGAATARAVSWVRDLANRPGNMLTTTDLVAEARSLASSHGLSIKVVSGPALDAEGFGCIAGVGRASQHPAAFVALEHRGGGEGTAPVVLVGKGITFDTGGICIKPRAGMEEMKTDMHGAASVLGALRVAAERKLPVNLVGLLAIAENMPDDRAFKPGDVLTAYNGMTVEVIDTDAEGRVVMADAIGYAAKHYAPSVIIDLATLTGSIVMALGEEATGLFTNTDALAAELASAGTSVGERVWRMPTWEDYAGFVHSSIADVKNASKEKGDAIAAAMFLKAFAGDYPWVHLDIAGSSWMTTERPYRPKGATGVGVRLLTRWLEARLASK